LLGRVGLKVIIWGRRIWKDRRMVRRRILVRPGGNTVMASAAMGRAIGTIKMTIVVAVQSAVAVTAIVARLRRAERRASEGMMSWGFSRGENVYRR
jgi:hypothetical protein